MARAEDEIDGAALDWAIRTSEPGFSDWETFAVWLATDPRHAERYHALEADAAALAGIIPAAPAAALPRAGGPTRRRWIAGALAAAVAGVIGYAAVQTRPDLYVVETRPGTSRTIALTDGSSIALNGGTRLTLDRHDERFAALERGEALFTVRHDAARPFKVDVGGNELVDIGTQFDVIRSDGKMWVGVAEGALIFNPRKEAVPLPAGRALTSSDASDTVQVADVAVASVGAWHEDRLDFAGAPLVEVAAALSRSLGTRFAVAPVIAGRPFHGTLSLAALRSDPTRLGPLLGAKVRRAGDGWEITAAP